jgi:hypothetical protein
MPQITEHNTTRIAIVGSRTYEDRNKLFKRCDEFVEEYGFEHVTVLYGMAKGADSLGRDWAKLRGHTIENFPALWHRYGRAAGPIRNEQMAKHTDYVLAFWNGRSSGTKDMINTSRALGKPVFIF